MRKAIVLYLAIAAALILPSSVPAGASVLHVRPRSEAQVSAATGATSREFPHLLHRGEFSRVADPDAPGERPVVRDDPSTQCPAAVAPPALGSWKRSG